MRFYLRYVPAKLNHADGPSRGENIAIQTGINVDTGRGHGGVTGVATFRGQG